MGKKLLCLFLCFLMLLTNVPMTVLAAEGTNMETVYVDDTGADTASGESGSPVKTLEKALSKVKEGGTIVIADKLSLLRPSEDIALHITKAVTLEGGTLNIDYAGIVLGADVEFKNINISLNNTVRNAIIANGYTLTLNSVKKGGSNNIKVFAGAITQGQHPYPQAGTEGEVIVKGRDNQIADIYAGNFSDLGAYNNGANPTVDSHFAGDINITIEDGTTGTVGNIYAFGGRENREGTSSSQGEVWSGVEEQFTVQGDLTIRTYGTVAKNIFGASDKKAHVIFNSEYMNNNSTFSGIDTLEVNGLLCPEVLDDDVNIIINSGGELDITELVAASHCYVNNFTGTMEGTPGILTLGATDTLVVNGNMSGKVSLQTTQQRPMDKMSSGTIEGGHPYVICYGTSVGNEIEFTPYTFLQPAAALIYSQGTWTGTLGGTQEEEELLPVDFSLGGGKTEFSITPSEMNTTGISIPITFDFGDNMGFGFAVPLKIKVGFGSQDNYRGVQVDPEGDYVYCVDALRMSLYVTEDSEGAEILFLGKCIDHDNHADMLKGTYRINVTVTTTGGEVTRTITLHVTDTIVEPSKTSLNEGQLSLKSGILYTYDGRAKEPALSDLELMLEGEKVTLSDDYTVAYSNNVNAGTQAQVTLSAKESNEKYSGSVSGKFSIEKRPLTIEAKAQKVRNEEAVLQNLDQVLVENLATGDTLSEILLTADEEAKTIIPSKAKITREGQEVTSNYQITYQTGNLQRIRPEIIVTVAENIVYDGNSVEVGEGKEISYTLKDCKEPAITWYHKDGQELAKDTLPKDAGEYTLKITAEDDASQSVEVTKAVEIQQAEVSLVWENDTERSYRDGKTVTATLSGVINNDIVTPVISGHEETEVGTYTARVTGLAGEQAKNYRLTGTLSREYEIQKAPAIELEGIEKNIRWSEAGEVSLELSDFTLPQNIKNASITEVTKSGETLDTGNVFGNQATVLNGKVLIPMTKPSGYIEGTKGIFLITIASDTHENLVAEIIIHLVDKNIVDDNIRLLAEDIVYGELPQPLGSFQGNSTGEKTEEYVYSKEGSQFAPLDSYKNQSGLLPQGTYTVRYTYSDSRQIGTKSVTFEVEKKSLDIFFEASSVTKVYDGTSTIAKEQFPQIMYTGAVAGETPVIDQDHILFEYENKDVGNQKVIVARQISLVAGQAVNENYDIADTVSSSGAVITPASLTIEPEKRYTKQYGQADPVLEYTAFGLLDEDVLTGDFRRIQGEEVGSYAYDISNLSHPNYQIELAQNVSSFTITKAQAVLTLEADVTKQKAGEKIKLTVSADSKNTLVAQGTKKPQMVETEGVIYTALGQGVFEGEYRVPETSVAGEVITLTVQIVDTNYEAENNPQIQITVVEEEKFKVPDGIWIKNMDNNMEYHGQKQLHAFELYDGEKLLVEKKDYTVSYKNNVNAYEFGDHIPQDVVVAGLEGKKETVIFSDTGEIEAGKEEQLSSKEKKKAPQLTIKMKGNYTGSYKIYFQIHPIDLDREDVAADALAVTYNGKNQRPAPTVTWKGKKLAMNKDFTVAEYTQDSEKREFIGDEQSNTQKVLTLQGKGNFTGDRKITFTIGKKKGTDGVQEIAASKITVKNVVTKNWQEGHAEDGMKQENLVVKYKNDILSDEEYEISYAHHNAAGTATLIIEGTGVDADGDKLAYIGIKKVNYQIKGTDISKVKVEGIKEFYPYTGEEIRPMDSEDHGGIKVIDGATGTGKEMVKDTHFTVEYEKNVARGTAVMVLKGKPETGYTGTRKIAFKIAPDKLTKENYQIKIVDKAATLEGENVKMPFTKGGVTPRVEVRDADGRILNMGTDYTIKYQKNTAIASSSDPAKAPRIILTGKGNYSGSETLFFEIVAKDLSLEENADDVKIVVNDKVEKAGKNGWKSNIKLIDQNGKALNAKDADTKNAKYIIWQLPENLEGIENKEELERLKNEGTDLTSVPQVVLPKGTKIKVTVSMKTMEKGGSGNYQGEVEATYRILEKGYDISKAKITLLPKDYTGEAIEILGNADLDESRTYLKMVSGKKAPLLLEEKDGKQANIEVVPGSYVKNVEKGTARVTFRGKEGTSYGGTKTVTFKIKQRGIKENFKGFFTMPSE